MAANKSTRREFIKDLGKDSLAGAPAPGLLTSCSSKQKPNIIFILADVLGYGDLGKYGQHKIKTPFLDQMALEGMKFTQFYTGSTVCASSRCSLMTGFHTGHCEIRGNKAVLPEGQYPISSAANTVADLLKSAGYKTGAIGKWGLGNPGSEGAPEKQGFNLFFGYNCQREAHFFYPTHLWRNEEKVDIPENADRGKVVYSHDLIVEEALQFIKDNEKNPFFLFLPFTIPHAELAIPEDDLSEYDGISFYRVLQGKKQSKHDYRYWEFHEQGGKQAVLMDNWKGIRLNVFKNPGGPLELYDLSQDKSEQFDISDQHPGVVEKIRLIMKEARTESSVFPFLNK